MLVYNEYILDLTQQESVTVYNLKEKLIIYAQKVLPRRNYENTHHFVNK